MATPKDESAHEAKTPEEALAEEALARAPAKAPAQAPATRTLDTLGIVSFALYLAVGATFVYGFGRSLDSAVQTQNETSCRALRPAHTWIKGKVLDQAGQPVAGAEVVPVIGERSGMPIKADPEDGSFEVFMPKGPQGLRVRAPEKEGLETEFVVGTSELLDVHIVLADQGQQGGDFQVVGRQPYAAPDFVVRDLSGNEVKLEDYRGRLVVLNFWATYCEPCITEWPQLARLAERLADNKDVAVLAISIDEKSDGIQPFLQQMSLAETDIEVLWDESTTLHTQLGSDKIPDTYIIDEKGQVQSVFVNVREWGSPSALHCVESSIGR